MAEKISIGGQALIEGIMMKGKDKYSVAVRKPDGSIKTQVHDVQPAKFNKIPILRGIFSFVQSLAVGYKCLMYSADESMDGAYEEDKFEKWLKKHFGEKASSAVTTVAGVAGTMLALVLFMVLPTAITGFVDEFISLGGFKSLIEGIVKLLIFFIYLWSISKMREIHRVFCYHGAEHKTIFCYEAGLPLTVENVRIQSRFHPRCGTSFMFIVLVVSIIVFSFVPWHGTLQRAVLKVIFLPLVMGIAYEILRFTGTHDNKLTKILAAPGLFFQRLTTAEPDDSMIEVAIASVNAILPETKVAENLNETV